MSMTEAAQRVDAVFAAPSLSISAETCFPCTADAVVAGTATPIGREAALP
jgi:hypothetical protein